jgi:cytochrome oxidase Cu insertion factor (SCO1/SenC/PrrC family)
MVRLVFCAAQVLLAVAFSMPGCAKNKNTLPPPEPAEDSAASRIGTLAPEIAGEDMDGAFFKLSDYRGKVVLLDFWGHW